MKIKLYNTFAVVSTVLLTILGTASARAGTTTIVDMPPTGTDAGSGITNINNYVCAFDYGNSASAITIFGVPFTHFQLAAVNVFPSTNIADVNFGGHVVLSTGGVNGSKLASTSNTAGLSTQADGSMVTLLTDCVYPGAVSSAGDWIQQEFDNLNPGDNYSLRVYYRRWNNEGSVRNNSFTFHGDTTNLTVTVDPDTGGAHYIEYDFTAHNTNAFCLISNLLVVTTQQPWLLYGATMQDTFQRLAPIILTDNSAAGIGNGIYQFSVQAAGVPVLSYQWYTNSVNSYVGAAATTDGNDYSGSTTNILTATNNLLDYYFAIVTNSYGSATSSIVQINPAPGIVTQPTSTNIANTYVAFNMTANGFSPLAYQWYFNTTSNYTGATMTIDGNGYSGSTTNSLMATTNLQDYYFVVVTNDYGSVTSSIAAYSPYPVIVTNNTSSIVGTSIVGGSIGFSMTASGWPILGYKWYYNIVASYAGANVLTDGGGVSGSTTNNVAIANAAQYYYSDYYFVVVSNYYGSVTSSIAQAISQLTVVAAGEPIWNQTSQTNILITFSDRLDPVTAATVGNYSLTPSATISSATVVASNEVALTTSPLTGSYTLTVQNVNDYFGLTIRPASTNIAVGIYPANLALWVSAGTNVITDANGVNEWDDISGNGNNLYTISANEPQLATNVYGDTVIHFTGTPITNEMEAFSSPTLAITGDMSVIAVMNFTTTASGDIVSKTSSANKNIAAPYDCYMTASGAALYRGNGGGSGAGVSYGAYAATNAPTIGIPHIVAISESGNTVSDFVDGNARGTGLLSGGYKEASDADAGQVLTVGWRAYGDMLLTGDISELIVAGSAISSYDVTQLDNYLITKHNFLNIASTNLVFSALGGNLTLSWPADHTGWTLQSQTNKLSVGISTNWVNVVGSTATNQVVIPLNLTNGSVFYRLMYQH